MLPAFQGCETTAKVHHVCSKAVQRWILRTMQKLHNGLMALWEVYLRLAILI